MSVNMKVIDFRNRPPLAAFEALFQQKQGLLVKRFANASHRGMSAITPSMFMVGKDGAMEQWWKEIDEAGIDAVVCNGRLSDDRGSIDSKSLADIQRQYGGRFFGLASVNLEQDIHLTVEEIERDIKELGLRGINIEPCLRKKGGPAQVDNKDLFPIYEAMSALDVPVMVYTSPYAGPDLDFANNMAPYDRVLQMFPKLKLILGHGGYPNIVQVLGAAIKHPNLYICPDFYMFCPGGELYQQSLTTLQDQFIFGTSYPFCSLKEPLEDTLKLPVSQQVMEKYLWANAAHLLKI